MPRFLRALGPVLLAVSHASAGDSPFAVSPAEALARFAESEAKLSPFAEIEAELFADGKDGKLDRFTLAEACLIVGGVTDARKRNEYLAIIDRVESEAQKATADSRSPAERGARLLQFLHRGPMAKGFSARQTNLHTLLDRGEFNCVSSTVLFVVIGRRLGLDVRAVEVREHMFAIVRVEDRTMDVEATDPAGFDPADHGQPGPAKARRSGTRRVVDDCGLAAVISYNHGVALAEDRQFAAAIRADLVALTLDSSNAGAASNATAHLVNWGAELIRQEQYAEAAAILATGRKLAPMVAAFEQNTRALYDAWADRHMKRGDWAGAVRIYERSLGELPGDRHLAENLAYCREQVRAAVRR